MRYAILPALLLLLLALSGCAYYHVIETGDTMYDLSKEYGVSVQEIQEANPGVDPYNLQIGEKLKIPRFPEDRVSDITGRHRTPEPTKTPKPVERTPKPTPTPKPYEKPEPTPEMNSRPEPTPQPTPATAPEENSGENKFVWPVQGKIANKFGDRQAGVILHGLEIAAPVGTPVYAAEAGTVIMASNRFKGYGNMVIIKHSNGFVSIYAYNQRLWVKKDQRVKRGQKIAEVGQSGRAEKPMLLFELRIGSQAVDPLKYLPAR
ncbi:MAG TPA: M23 family metallopeptidase [bacterium]|nr:M23 family metallopeptidase [bacterium]